MNMREIEHTQANSTSLFTPFTIHQKEIHIKFNQKGYTGLYLKENIKINVFLFQGVFWSVLKRYGYIARFARAN